MLLTGIRRWFGNGFKSQRRVEAEEDERIDAVNAERKANGMKPFKNVKREEKEKEGKA